MKEAGHQYRRPGGCCRHLRRGSGHWEAGRLPPGPLLGPFCAWHWRTGCSITGSAPLRTVLPGHSGFARGTDLSLLQASVGIPWYLTGGRCPQADPRVAKCRWDCTCVCAKSHVYAVNNRDIAIIMMMMKPNVRVGCIARPQLIAEQAVARAARTLPVLFGTMAVYGTRAAPTRRRALPHRLCGA